MPAHCYERVRYKGIDRGKMNKASRGPSLHNPRYMSHQPSRAFTHSTGALELVPISYEVMGSGLLAHGLHLKREKGQPDSLQS